MNWLPKSAPLTGTGRLAQKTREQERSERRHRVTGYGTTSGPLGTSVAYTPTVRAKATGGRDTWAR
jgi:hypothetical protein